MIRAVGFAISLSVFLLLICVAAAQDQTPPVFYTSPDYIYTYWEPSIKGLVIRSTEYETNASTWLRYSLSNKTLLPFDYGVVYGSIAKQLRRNADTFYGNQEVLFSPDGKYVAYLVDGDDESWSGERYVVVAAVANGKAFIVKDMEAYIYDSPDDFTMHENVHWSGDSSALYIEYLHRYSFGYFLVENLTPAMDSVEVVNINDNVLTSDETERTPLEEAIGGVIYYVIAMDRTGDFLLVQAALGDAPTEMSLLLVKVSDGTYTLLDIPSLSGATYEQARSSNIYSRNSFTFDQANDKNIYYVNEEGLFVYDRTSGTSTLKDETLNLVTFDYINISPDGRYAAVILNDPSQDTWQVAIQPVVRR